MVLVAFEMIEEDMARYLAEMDPIERELMVLDHKIIAIFGRLETETGGVR